MNTTGLEIAIIGMAGRFPGASTLAEFWQNLRQGVESIQRLSEAELRAQGVDSALLQHPQYVRASAVLEGIDRFDADFFGISPKEAEILDPQQRLFLECAWEALEDAGYDAERYRGMIGVYAGAAMNSYLLNLLHYPDLEQTLGRYQLFLASDKDFLTTRVSYKLNLTGPSVDVQTACSTSLVAVHMACQSLLGGECDMALAGGVALSQPVGYLYQEGGIYSPDGHCRAFDAEAAGTVAGSGLGIVVLKRLDDALADRDFIYAVIKGSAINNDGAQKVSYTAPSISAQAQVIRAAQQVAGVGPETISYVETHGTGTPLGDPIEIAALSEAFQSAQLPPRSCAIGSLKPNIGHLDTAAGIASLIKTVLALQHRQIPPSLYFQQPNPQINFAQTPFYVNTQLTDWRSPDPNLPLRAGVSSFGIGGTNAHVVLEAAPAPTASGPSRPWQILSLSAKTPTALDRASARLLEHLRQHPDLNLADVAYTLHCRRAFPHRRTLLCQTRQDAIQILDSGDPARLLSQTAAAAAITFLFPGQGSQYPSMARHLYDHEPVFRHTIDHCSSLLLSFLNLDLRTLLYPSPPISPLTPLTPTHHAQPALFVVEYALAQLWRSWGIQPTAMIGHSLGEYVAATLAGVFDLEDALRLVALRGQLMQACPAGAMLSVSLSAAQTEAMLQPWFSELSLAAENAPQLCVVSGREEAIAALQQQLDQQQIPNRRLHVSHAFHSDLMQSVLYPFGTALRQIQLRPPQIPLISNLTGTWLTAAQATDPDYWLAHLRQTVRFSAGIITLQQQPERVWLEVGPGQTLSQLVKAHYPLPSAQTEAAQSPTILPSLSSAQAAQPGSHSAKSALDLMDLIDRSDQVDRSDQALMLRSLSQLWLAGAPIDWSQFYAAETRHRLPLPTYPFERQRYWLDLPSSANPSANRWSEKTASPPSNGVTPTSTQTLLYQPTWERTQPLPIDPDRLAAESHRWLVCLDSSGIAAALAQQLTDAGQDVFTVAMDTDCSEQRPVFTQLGYRAFALNPQQPADYRALQTDLQQRDLLPDRIVYGWSLDNAPLEALIFLTQIFAAATIPTQLTLLTTNAQDVTGEEALVESTTEGATVQPAALLGLALVIGQEYPHWSCRQIDLGCLDSPTRFLIEALGMELVTEPTLTERIIAYRGNHRWRQQFQAIAPQPGKPLWRPQGHYLIVGDWEQGVGRVWAKSLAALKVNLTLIRSQPSLSVNPANPANPADATAPTPVTQFVASLEALGASCILHTANLLDINQIQAILAASEAKFGDLNGVFYATPMSNEQSMGLLADLTPATWQQKWHYCHRTKIAGLTTLDTVLSARLSARLPARLLDFCLLQSSLSSIVGGLGLGAYAAANRAIDAFAQSKRLRHWISLNWDAYDPDINSDTKLDTNLDIDSNITNNINDTTQPSTSPPGFGSGLATVALSAERVWTATELALSSGCSGSIIVCKTDLQHRIQQAFAPAPAPTAHSRTQLSRTYAPPRSEIEQIITQQWQQLLGIDPIGIHDSFFELGGHSLLAIQAIAQLRQTFQIELPISSLLLEAPTVAEIAALVTQQQNEQSPDLTTLTDLLTEIQTLSPEAIQQELSS
ncbi:acyltransferase domain-containing protein [Leptolyngbya sp. NK1-12]|uniref:Acyltransferase domain-containing protein n=1 Tax=Leptolyngbya sp. NK1-12 TaxID=2547451 RepID=A0AA97APD9_9CYAN|nr:acyltransferase domain-containing protein [Leptolyngbya sp. NK1-12]